MVKVAWRPGGAPENSTGSSYLMNHNLAIPYTVKPSPPFNPLLQFHSPEAPDMLFSGRQDGGQIEILCQAGWRSTGLSWTLHHNMVERPFCSGHGEGLPGNCYRITLDSALLRPGFFDLRVQLETGLPSADQEPQAAICTFGWEARAMPLCDTRPADFRQFWETARQEVAALDLDVRLEEPPRVFGPRDIAQYNLDHACLPADYDAAGHVCEEVESFKISFAGPDGGRVYGWLARPLGPGPFPAMLVLPGAGFAARPRPLEHARHGYVALDIQIHGQDVDLEEYPHLPGYGPVQGAQHAREHYYYRVHQRVLLAIEALLGQPKVDAERLVVVGGSQGGRLALVAAGLDSRVAAVVSCIANSPNYPHLNWVSRLNGRTCAEDDPRDPAFAHTPRSDGQELVGAPPLPTHAAGRHFAYFDPMNYAPDISCPVLMSAGLIDPVSPPYSIWGVFNRLQCRAKMVPLPALGHDWSAAFDREAWKWLQRTLDISW